jgi:hypothetical protein
VRLNLRLDLQMQTTHDSIQATEEVVRHHHPDQKHIGSGRLSSAVGSSRIILVPEYGWPSSIISLTLKKRHRKTVKTKPQHDGEKTGRLGKVGPTQVGRTFDLGYEL